MPQTRQAVFNAWVSLPLVPRTAGIFLPVVPRPCLCWGLVITTLEPEPSQRRHAADKTETQPVRSVRTRGLLLQTVLQLSNEYPDIKNRLAESEAGQGQGQGARESDIHVLLAVLF